MTTYASDIVAYIPDDGEPTPEQIATLKVIEDILEGASYVRAGVPEDLTVNGHLYLHAAICLCPKTP